jgi:regulator of protease activity HflC (stomatin/prohibitin superfamily)
MAEPSIEFYLRQISAYEREFKRWENRVEKIIKSYRDDEKETIRAGKTRFNILWSNVQTLKAATFSRMPMPDVSRRFKDNDPVGRVAALILERALEYEVKHHADFGASIRQCIYDRFLGGRGVAWVRYEMKEPEQEGEEQVTEDIDNLQEIVESCPVDYVHWRDFGHQVARTWEECSIVWRRVYMTRKAVLERFPDWGDKIPMDATPDERKWKSNAEGDNVGKLALIFEIWDKEAGQAVWISKSLGKIIDQKPDPLGLEDFFPCPRPIYATLTTDNLIPLPDYTMYQDQARELDTLAERIDGLVKALKVMGVYDASQPEIARLFSEGENTNLIPVNQWTAFAEKQGLKGSIDLVDIQPVAAALKDAYVAFEQIKQQIYELTGISDILRGQTAPSETATAQQIKNSYASLRLKVYQDEVERFASNLLRLKAQIICDHFSPETIARIASVEQLSHADQQMIMPALQLLKDRSTEQLRIEVASDSMVYLDEQQEKSDRMEFLSATSQFVEKMVQAGQMAPQLIPLGVEMLKFGVTGFRVGKSLEGTIDQAAEQMKAMAQQQAQNPPPHPDAMKVQADQQATQMKIQADQQSDQARIQADMQIAQAKAQADGQLEQMRLQAEAQSKEMERQHQAALEQMKAQYAQAQAAQQMEFDRWKAQLDSDTKVLVAEISAKTSLQTAAMSATTDATEVGPDGSTKPSTPFAQIVDAVNDNLGKLIDAQTTSHKELIAAVTKPRKAVRGPDGRIIEVH